MPQFGSLGSFVDPQKDKEHAGAREMLQKGFSPLVGGLEGEQNL